MYKIKIIHIDDDEVFLKDTEKLLENFSDTEYIGGYTDAAEGVTQIINKAPDLVFLDIDVQNGNKNIFSFLTEVNIKSQIVFITGHKQYAFQSYKNKALHYLLKPVSIEDLRYVIDEAKKSFMVKNIMSIATMAKDFIDTMPDSKKRIQINTSGKIYLENFADIEWVEADGNYTKFHKTDGEIITSGKILKVYRNTILLNENFIEVSRSAIVNQQCIKAIVRDKHKASILLSSNKKVEISILKKDEVIEKIKNFL